MDEEKLISDLEAKILTPDPPPVVAAGVAAVESAIDVALRPGMPLSTLIKIVRKAPLQSIAVAFLLGMAVARRR